MISTAYRHYNTCIHTSNKIICELNLNPSQSDAFEQPSGTAKWCLSELLYCCGLVLCFCGRVADGEDVPVEIDPGHQTHRTPQQRDGFADGPASPTESSNTRTSRFTTHDVSVRFRLETSLSPCNILLAAKSFTGKWQKKNPKKRARTKEKVRDTREQKKRAAGFVEQTEDEAGEAGEANEWQV